MDWLADPREALRFMRLNSSRGFGEQGSGCRGVEDSDDLWGGIQGRLLRRSCPDFFRKRVDGSTGSPPGDMGEGGGRGFSARKGWVGRVTSRGARSESFSHGSVCVSEISEEPLSPSQASSRANQHAAISVNGGFVRTRPTYKAQK